VLTLQPFTPELTKVRHALSYLDTWGSTSLYDAISGVAGKIHDRGESRRAIVLFTDGADTGSSLTPADASSIASALDVPIYVFALNPSSPRPVDGKAPEPALAQVARATGGLYFSATDAPTLQSQVNTLIDELHHQQVLAFEASTEPGWRSLELRVRKRGYKIRSRGWYWAGETPAPATLPESR
jgi:Ca-activated chloride channel family protein